MAVLAVLARDGSDPSTVYQHYRGEGSAFIQRALDDVVRVLAPTAGSSTIAEIVRSAMGRYDALEAAAIQETVGVVAVATTWAAEAAAEAMAENSTSSAVAPVTMPAATEQVPSAAVGSASPAATEQVPSAAVGSASGGRHDEPEGCGRSVVERAAAPGSGATCDDVARSAVVTQATTAIGAPAAVPDGAVTRPARHAALKVQVEEARQNAQQAQQQLWDCQASEQQCAVALEAACAEADYDDEDTKETLRPALGVVAASCCRLGWQHYGPAVWVGGWLGGCNWTPEWSVEGRALPHCLCCVCRSSPLGRDACRGDLPKGRPKKAAIAYRDAHAATAGATERMAAARAALNRLWQRLCALLEEARQDAQQAQQRLWDCQASEQQCAVALEHACAEADYDDEDTKETLRPALGVVAASCCRLGWQHYGPAVWVGGWLGGCNWTPEWSVEGRALPHCLCCVCRSSPLGRDACRGDLPKGRPKKAAIAYRDAHAATAGATKRVAAARAELGQVQRLADTCASGPAAETKGLDAPATAAAPALPPRPTLPQVVPPSLSSVCPCWFGG